MKLQTFNEALENLGRHSLTEANENIDIKQALAKRYDNLSKIQAQIVQNLSQTKIADYETMQYNETLLHWLVTLSGHMSRIASGKTYDAPNAIKYVDYYTKQIVDSIKSGKLVYESLTESMAQTFKKVYQE